MTGQWIIQRARSKADTLLDVPPGDDLWSPDDWVVYLNDALNEICIEAKLIKDADTAEICTISIVAETAIYALDERIISIDPDQVYLSTLKRFLYFTNEAYLRRNIRDGWPESEGDPTHYIPDYKRKKIRFFRKPKSNDTANLVVYRLPLYSFTTDNIGTLNPEIEERLHHRLVDGVLSQAYEKNDSDTKDLSALKVAVAKWTDTIEMEKRRWIQRETNPQEIVSIEGGMLP